VSHLTPGGFGPPSESSPRSMSVSETRTRRGSGWVLVPATLLAVSAFGFWFRTKQRQVGAQDASAAAAPAPPVPSGVPLPPITPEAKPDRTVAETKVAARQIRLSIDASPSGAQLYLDDKRLETNPYVGTVGADGASHKIRAVAQGFDTETRTVTLDKDVDVKLSLARPKVGKPAPAPHAAATHEAHATAPAAPAAAGANCNPPFTLDADGIRRFKPECL
jgi:hypothetical protein